MTAAAIRLLPMVNYLLLTAFLACARKPDLPKLFAVPATTLIDERGQSLDLDTLKGNVVVYDFIFTSCTGTCPIMTNNMRASPRASTRPRPSASSPSPSTPPATPRPSSPDTQFASATTPAGPSSPATAPPSSTSPSKASNSPPATPCRAASPPPQLQVRGRGQAGHDPRLLRRHGRNGAGGRGKGRGAVARRIGRALECGGHRLRFRIR
jgi:SCO1/SenC